MDRQDYLDHAVLDRLKTMGAGFPNKLIALFLEHTPRRLDTALAGGRAKDWKAVEDAAHSLKSSAGNLGAVRLRELADRLEEAAATGREGNGSLDVLSSLLAELESTYARTRELLIEVREKNKP